MIDASARICSVAVRPLTLARYSSRAVIEDSSACAIEARRPAAWMQRGMSGRLRVVGRLRHGRNRCFGCTDQLRPDSVPVVGPRVPAADLPACSYLDGGGVLGRGLPSGVSMPPLADLDVALDADALAELSDGERVGLFEVGVEVHGGCMVANATAFASSQCYGSVRYSVGMPPNPSQDTQEFRRERLSAAAKQAGGNAPLGRLLGYRDGAFVGQMLRGERPITEKTVTALESKPGYRDWFAATGNVVQEPPASYSEPLALSPSERDLVLALRKLSQADQQETIRDVMHRAEAVEKMVERVLSDRGISFSAYLSATRAAETLPAPPAGQRIPDRKPGDPDEMESPISRKQQWPESKEGKS